MSDAHRAHDGAVLVKKGRLVGLELEHPPAAFHHLVKKAGAALLKHGIIRFQTDVFALFVLFLFEVPDIIMAASLYLALGLAYGVAKGIVDLQMRAPHVLEPDQIGNAVNGGVQIGFRKPPVLAFLEGGQMPPQARGQPRGGEGRKPHVVNGLQLGLVESRQPFRLHAENKERTGLAAAAQLVQGLTQRQVDDGDVRRTESLGRQGRTKGYFMLEALQGHNAPKPLLNRQVLAEQSNRNPALVHAFSPLAVRRPIAPRIGACAKPRLPAKGLCLILFFLSCYPLPSRRATCLGAHC